MACFIQLINKETVMPKYIRQNDEDSCTAIAIINALKWAGKKTSKKQDFFRLVENCYIIQGRGSISQVNFETTLKQEGKNFLITKKYFNPDFKKIKKHLCYSTNSIILKFCEYKQFGHVTFIEKFENGFYKLINFEKGKTYSYLNEEGLKQLLDYKSYDLNETYTYPYV